MIDRREFCLGLGALSTMLISPFHVGAQETATPDSGQHPVEPMKDTMTQAQRDARMAWWDQARFGMFIHWGLYAEAAGYWNGKPVPVSGRMDHEHGQDPGRRLQEAGRHISIRRSSTPTHGFQWQRLRG